MKNFIEFENHIFSPEDVTLVERYYDYRDGKEGKIWSSLIKLGDNIYFRFPESNYNQIKEILLGYNKGLD